MHWMAIINFSSKPRNCIAYTNTILNRMNVSLNILHFIMMVLGKH